MLSVNLSFQRLFTPCSAAATPGRGGGGRVGIRSWKEGEGEREEARIKHCLITKDSAMQVNGGAREPF